MKNILLLAWLLTSVFAYQSGDAIDQDIADRLGIRNDNNIYVVDFFASWCGSCRKELPLISELSRRTEHSGVTVIGVDVDKDIEKGKAFQRTMAAKGALAFRVVDDPSSAVISLFDPIGMPALYIVKDRKVDAVIFGAQEHIDRRIEDEIRALR